MTTKAKRLHDRASKAVVTKLAESITDEIKKAIASGKRKSPGDLLGPFKLSSLALKAGTPDVLPLRPDSARYLLMATVYGAPTKVWQRDELHEVLGDQTSQALRGMVRYGLLDIAA